MIRGAIAIATRHLHLFEFELRKPQKILIGHSVRKQRRDLAKHAGVDARAPDEAPDPIEIERGIILILICDEMIRLLAQQRRQIVRQTFRYHRGLVVRRTGEICDQRPNGRAKIHVGLGLCRRRKRLVLSCLLRKLRLKPAQILKQPGTDEPQEIESEGRVLHVKLFDLRVADRKDQP